MRRLLLGLFSAPAILMTGALNVSAQKFVYTNNDPSNPAAPNSVTAFSVGVDGALTPIPGSPFPTGGTGTPYFPNYAPNRIVTSPVGRFLYVSNPGTDTISAFVIDPGTGVLTTVPGSPFPSLGQSGAGTSLAVTPDGSRLYAAHSLSQTVTIFNINPDGSLTSAGPPVNTPGTGQPNNAKVTPNGRFLGVVLQQTPDEDDGGVDMFSIDAATGALTPVAGSPFHIRPNVAAAALDFNCASDTTFVGNAVPDTTTVDVLSISSSGALTPIPGSPFRPGVGLNSNVPLLSPDDSTLFVSNQDSFTVTVLTVNPDKSLTLVSGSPFSVGGSEQRPAVMATDAAGMFLYTANSPHSVSVFRIGTGGVLTLVVPGSPFETGVTQGYLTALAAFPPKVCR